MYRLLEAASPQNRPAVTGFGGCQARVNRCFDSGGLGDQRFSASARPTRALSTRLQRLLHGREEQDAHQLPEDDEAYELNDERYVGR